MGLAHYDHGWHATATVELFEAAVGVAHLLGLNASQVIMALGIAGLRLLGSSPCLEPCTSCHTEGCHEWSDGSQMG